METFGSKLKQMRKDLASIVDRMNRDRSHDCALKAQAVLMAVASLEDAIDGEFSGVDDLEWDWQPEEEKP